MPEIAVLVKTRDRDEALFNCLRSVRIRLREQGFDHRIYLADDGPVSEVKAAAYERLREEGHVVLRFERDVGVGLARNVLADQLEDEPWVLRTDDDFQLTGETDVAAMRRILREVPELGLVADLERQVGDGKGVFSGQISDAQGFFERRGGTLVSRLLPPDAFTYRRAGGHRYALCDFTRNLLLIRRELLEEVRWEERLPFAGEHEDFLLQTAEAGWKIGFTPDSVHRHRGDLGARGWSLPRAERRRMREEALEVFREKWGVRRRTTRRGWKGTLRAGLVRLKGTADRLARRLIPGAGRRGGRAADPGRAPASGGEAPDG